MGGGKSYALLLEPLRHWHNPNFGAVIFRRSNVQIRNSGALWDESAKLYMPLGARPREMNLEWKFPSGASVKFAHLELDRTVYDWQGSQIPLLGFDELTHFSEEQFTYMLSRNRSTSGVPGYVRATCNPDADSWVRKLVDWYIGPDGYAIKERSGVIRWFIRQDNDMVWADTREELLQRYGTQQQPKSFTFISASLQDNKILMEKDPSYLSNLMALARVERERLLGGNWNVRPSAGDYFQREWFKIIDAIPPGWSRCVRYWDKAATRPSESNPDPDYTAGVLIYSYPNGQWVIADIRRTRDTPLNIERYIKNTASYDGWATSIRVEQEPGSSGVADADNYVRLLVGYDIRVNKVSKDKVTRALPVSAQCEAGNISVLRAQWNDEFFREAENFDGSDKGHDDQIDALSGAFNETSASVSSFANL